jgi:hypothetical protein
MSSHAALSGAAFLLNGIGYQQQCRYVITICIRRSHSLYLDPG